jgi:universal stress protein A
MNAHTTNPLPPPPENPSVPTPEPRPATPTPPVIRLKKILTPIDFSDASQQALHYAVAFAERFQASLVLLHIVEFNFMGSDFGAVELSQIEADLEENASRQLEDWVKRKVGSRVPAEPLVRNGRPYLEIVEAAKSLDVDLIIIATHGHTSLAHVLLGSTVERVIRHAACPVLVVRREEHDFVEIGESGPAPAAAVDASK